MQINLSYVYDLLHRSQSSSTCTGWNILLVNCVESYNLSKSIKKYGILSELLLTKIDLSGFFLH